MLISRNAQARQCWHQVICRQFKFWFQTITPLQGFQLHLEKGNSERPLARTFHRFFAKIEQGQNSSKLRMSIYFFINVVLLLIFCQMLTLTLTLKEARKGFLVAIVSVKRWKITKKVQYLMVWTNYMSPSSSIVGLYFKGTCDVISVTMAMHKIHKSVL